MHDTVLENKVKVHVYKNFKERGATDMKRSRSWLVDALYCGPVLGARGMVFVVFWDWETGEVVRRINVNEVTLGQRL